MACGCRPRGEHGSSKRALETWLHRATGSPEKESSVLEEIEPEAEEARYRGVWDPGLIWRRIEHMHECWVQH